MPPCRQKSTRYGLCQEWSSPPEAIWFRTCSTKTDRSHDIEMVIRNEKWLFTCLYNPNSKFKSHCCDTIEAILETVQSEQFSSVCCLVTWTLMYYANKNRDVHLMLWKHMVLRMFSLNRHVWNLIIQLVWFGIIYNMVEHKCKGVPKALFSGRCFLTS